MKDDGNNNAEIINNDQSRLFIGCNNSPFDGVLVGHNNNDRRIYNNGRYDEWGYESGGPPLAFNDESFMNGVC